MATAVAVRRKYHVQRPHALLKSSGMKKRIHLLKNSLEKNTSSVLAKANKTSKNLKKDVDKFVTKNVSKKPLRAMGLIMLTGVCIGYIIHRR